MRKLKPDEIVEARLNGLDRRTDALELWTGAPQGENGDEIALWEEVSALGTLFSHLLMHLQLHVPGFSMERFREEFLRKSEQGEAMAAEENPGSAEFFKGEWKERSQRIIDRYLPRP